MRQDLTDTRVPNSDMPNSDIQHLTIICNKLTELCDFRTAVRDIEADLVQKLMDEKENTAKLRLRVLESELESAKRESLEQQKAAKDKTAHCEELLKKLSSLQAQLAEAEASANQGNDVANNPQVTALYIENKVQGLVNNTHSLETSLQTQKLKTKEHSTENSTEINILKQEKEALTIKAAGENREAAGIEGRGGQFPLCI